MKKFIVAGIIAGLISGVITGACVLFSFINFIPEPIQPIENQQIKRIECGACGAQVTDWWYVRNMTDTDFVEVCSFCYETIMFEN